MAFDGGPAGRLGSFSTPADPDELVCTLQVCGGCQCQVLCRTEAPLLHDAKELLGLDQLVPATFARTQVSEITTVTLILGVMHQPAVCTAMTCSHGSADGCFAAVAEDSMHVAPLLLLSWLLR